MLNALTVDQAAQILQRSDVDPAVLQEAKTIYFSWLASQAGANVVVDGQRISPAENTPPPPPGMTRVAVPPAVVCRDPQLISAPTCHWSDPTCSEQFNEVDALNQVLTFNARAECDRAQCERNWALNVNATGTMLANDCAARYPSRPMPATRRIQPPPSTTSPSTSAPPPSSGSSPTPPSTNPPSNTPPASIPPGSGTTPPPSTTPPPASGGSNASTQSGSGGSSSTYYPNYYGSQTETPEPAWWETWPPWAWALAAAGGTFLLMKGKR